MLLQHHEPSFLTVCGAAFVAGVLFPSIVRYMLKRTLGGTVGRTSNQPDDRDSKIYSLKHGVLNIKPSETEMWMNMGYWKDQHEPRDFPHACRSLLREVLAAAGLLLASSDNDDEGVRSIPDGLDVDIIDVGFGCGDQAIELLSSLRNLRSYIGITIDKKQFEFARQRLEARQFLTDGPLISSQHEHEKSGAIRQVFNADAAKPEIWQAGLKEAITASYPPGTEHAQRWVLGLDVLYHLSPSRMPLLAYACNELRASVMAFDLLLPAPSEQRPTTLQTCLLRIVSLLTSTPFTNFLTPDQYRSQLVAAGYLEQDIEIRDVSLNVFGPLVDFMEWQDKQLKHFGFGIGVFHAARWVFGWWARSGVVRGCIVVARKREDKHKEEDQSSQRS